MAPGYSKDDDKEPAKNIEIGARFISEESLGTVRFVGEVPPTKGKFLSATASITI